MSEKRIFIQPVHLSEEIPIVRNLLKSSALIETLNTIDRGDYGFTILGLKIMNVLELTLSVFLETSKQLCNLLVRDRDRGFESLFDMTSQDVIFINAFCLFAASVKAIEECGFLAGESSDNVEKSDGSDDEARVRVAEVQVKNTFKMGEVTELLRLDPETFSRKLVRDFQDYLHFYRDHPDPGKRTRSIVDVLSCCTAYFTLWKNSLEKAVMDSSFSLYRKALEETDVLILDKRYEGFQYFSGDTEESSQLMKVDLDDVIGNEDYLVAARKLALDVAGFDFATWENPKKVNPVLFALGNPGCGKTVTAHAIGNFFLDFCRSQGIRARFVIIRRTDWASSYQNASANQLLGIFRKNVLDFKGVVGIYWPDIDTAFAARDDSGIRNEEKNILGAVFGLFDGTILPKNGQWFMLCDANFMNMDSATISRITQDPYQVRGPEKPEHFVMLLRDVKLRSHREFLNISEEEWLSFGSDCLEFGLSGRSIENMSRKVISMIEDFEYPLEYFKADVVRKREIIRQCSKIITCDDLRRITDNYIRFEKDAEDKSARKRFEERVREITTYLSAEKIARATLTGIDT